MTFISKPGKYHHKLNGYRIFTMHNTVGKLMERIVVRKLARDLEDREIQPHANQGFQTKKMHMGKMQQHLHITCTKDSRGKNKQWL